ncbi:MAG TPA: hypothetical protein VNS33_18645 [Bradyrhizobium sp.]|nr:hypothetical protein [Bradyrhizobium sp.]
MRGTDERPGSLFSYAAHKLDQTVEIDVRSMNGTAVRRRDLPKAYQD